MKPNTLTVARISEEGKVYFTASLNGGTICPQRNSYVDVHHVLTRVVATTRNLKVTLWDGKTEVEVPSVPAPDASGKDWDVSAKESP